MPEARSPRSACATSGRVEKSRSTAAAVSNTEMPLLSVTTTRAPVRSANRSAWEGSMGAPPSRTSS